jgi:hypothetical protein
VLHLFLALRDHFLVRFAGAMADSTAPTTAPAVWAAVPRTAPATPATVSIADIAVVSILWGADLIARTARLTIGEFLLRLIFRVTFALVCFRADLPLATARRTADLAPFAVGVAVFFVVFFFVLFLALANRASW